MRDDGTVLMVDWYGDSGGAATAPDRERMASDQSND